MIEQKETTESWLDLAGTEAIRLLLMPMDGSTKLLTAAHTNCARASIQTGESSQPDSYFRVTIMICLFLKLVLGSTATA